MYLIIGFDDFDSHFGGCTTYMCYLLIKELIKRYGEDIIYDLPHLIRLNPYIPFKTRGNAAVKIILKTSENINEIEIKEFIISKLFEFSEKRGKSSPGIAIYKSENPNPKPEMTIFYKKALTDVITFEYALKFSKKFRVEVFGKRGIIGAIAAICAIPEDITFELLIYRKLGFERQEIKPEVVKLLDEITKPFTFQNIDEDQVLIMPSGPDPVYFGIRGDSPNHIIYFANYLITKLGLEIEGWLLYKTNQGTNEHVSLELTEVIHYKSIHLIDIVVRTERTKEGHVIAYTLNGHKLIAYRHLGKICTILEKAVNHIVEIWGGVKPDDENKPTIYVEGINVITGINYRFENPKCPKCGKSLKSLGVEKGFKCPKCGEIYKLDKLCVLEKSIDYRTYLPKLSEFRHLMKTPERIGVEGLSKYFTQKPIMWIL